MITNILLALVITLQITLIYFVAKIKFIKGEDGAQGMTGPQGMMGYGCDDCANYCKKNDKEGKYVKD